MDGGAIEMVSTMMPEGAGSPRRAGYKASWSPSVADDGSVAFLSDQTAMTASNGDDPVGAIPNWTDVYVGRPDGTLIKASMNDDPQPVPAVGDSYDPQISADGSKVVFVVGGKSNMPKTSGDQNPDTDVYLRDLSANTTVQVNVPRRRRQPPPGRQRGRERGGVHVRRRPRRGRRQRPGRCLRGQDERRAQPDPGRARQRRPRRLQRRAEPFAGRPHGGVRFPGLEPRRRRRQRRLRLVRPAATPPCPA